MDADRQYGLTKRDLIFLTLHLILGLRFVRAMTGFRRLEGLVG